MGLSAWDALKRALSCLLENTPARLGRSMLRPYMRRDGATVNRRDAREDPPRR